MKIRNFLILACLSLLLSYGAGGNLAAQNFDEPIGKPEKVKRGLIEEDVVAEKIFETIKKENASQIKQIPANSNTEDLIEESDIFLRDCLRRRKKPF